MLIPKSTFFDVISLLVLNLLEPVLAYLTVLDVVVLVFVTFFSWYNSSTASSVSFSSGSSVSYFSTIVKSEALLLFLSFSLSTTSSASSKLSR